MTISRGFSTYLAGSRQSFTMPWFKWHLGDFNMFVALDLWWAPENRCGSIGFGGFPLKNVGPTETGDLKISQNHPICGSQICHFWWANQWLRILKRELPNFRSLMICRIFQGFFNDKLPIQQKHASTQLDFFLSGQKSLPLRASHIRAWCARYPQVYIQILENLERSLQHITANGLSLS